VLVVDQDLERGDDVELGCVARGIDVARAETVCEAVRALGAGDVSLIVIDVSSARLTAAEHAALFHAVAPGVPVVMTIGADTPAGVARRFERLGFRVLPRPLVVDRLFDLAPADGVAGEAR
jgi:DNA-binding NtrC family response regulator